jgi:hypothetical protein
LLLAISTSPTLATFVIALYASGSIEVVEISLLDPTTTIQPPKCEPVYQVHA